MIEVSAHAITRYIERIAPVSRADALAAITLHERALDVAAKMGTATVRDSQGVRYVVKGGAVVTVLGADCRFNHPRKAA